MVLQKLAGRKIVGELDDKMTKKYRGKRPSPSTSATSVNVGTVMHGGDGKLWICKSYPRGNKRIKHWVRK